MEPQHPIPTTRLRIFAWNPNGIRALVRNNAVSTHARGHLEAFLRDQRPDILFFPETKGNRTTQFETQLKLEAVFEKALPGRKWKWYWSYCTRPGRHGNAVAVCKDIVVDETRYELVPGAGPETEGRVIALKLHERSITGGRNNKGKEQPQGKEPQGLWVVGLYVPNASSKLSRLDHKVRWLHQLRAFMDDLRGDDENSVVVIGDINVAPDMRDICNPSSNLQSPGYSQEERDTFAWMMQAAAPDDEKGRTGQGYVDVWRHRYPLPYKSLGNQGVYSFWNTRSRARDRNAGWRIDLVLMDRETFGSDGKCIADVMICPEYHGSDHCPVGVEVHLAEEKEVSLSSEITYSDE